MSFSVLFARRPSGGLVQVALATFPIGELLLGLVLADAVRILDLADELIALAGDLVELVVGQLAPLLVQLAFGLLPVSCDAVPVHGFPFSVMRCPLYRRAGSRYAAERRRQAWLKPRKEVTYLALGGLHVFVKSNYDPGPEFDSGTRKFSGARMRNGRARARRRFSSSSA